MTNDAFIAFWVGIGGGLVLGIFLSAVIIAIGNSIEGRNKNEKPF